MGLEDIATFRTLIDGVELYTADAVATERLVEEAARHAGIVYLVTTRQEAPVHHGADEALAAHATLAGERTPVHSLAVRALPRSGKPAELLDYEGISAAAIVSRVRGLA